MCAGNYDDVPTYLRSVSGFYLDRFEVTVGRFGEFFRAYEASGIPVDGAGSHPRIAGTGWNSAWTTLPDSQNPVDPQNPSGVKKPAVPQLQGDLDQQLKRVVPGAPTCTWDRGDSTLPITCVNWYVAFAFCIWDGGRLPTEAEWNFAASAGQGFPYPWSRQLTDEMVTTDYANYEGTTPVRVGSYTIGRGFFTRGQENQGHDDLAGNAAEWVSDANNPDMSQEELTDYMAPWTGVSTDRISRGGAFSGSFVDVRSGTRVFQKAETISPYQGFRCARDSKTKEDD